MLPKAMLIRRWDLWSTGGFLGFVLVDFISEKRSEVMSSSYYRKAASLADEADAIFKELTQNDTGTNIRKFYQKLKDYLVRKFEEGNLGNFTRSFSANLANDFACSELLLRGCLMLFLLKGQIVREIQSFFTNLWDQLGLTERIENMKQTWDTLVSKVLRRKHTYCLFVYRELVPVYTVVVVYNHK